VRTQKTSPDLFELSRAIPRRFIRSIDKGGRQSSYVPHWVVEQILLATVGPFSWELTRVLRGPVPATTTGSPPKVREWPALSNAVVGAVYRLTAMVDGVMVPIEETGSCDAGAYEDNDGERLKKAASDALKRCAMRLGVGIHLWCKTTDEFFLPTVLRAGEPEKQTEEAPAVGVEHDEEDDPTRPFEVS
jgi:hypothetical protein